VIRAGALWTPLLVFDTLIMGQSHDLGEVIAFALLPLQPHLLLLVPALMTCTSLACFPTDLHRLPCVAALVKSPLCQCLEARVRAAQEERCLMLTVQDAPDPLPAGALPVPAAAAKRKRAGVARGTAVLLEELPHGPGGMPHNACRVQYLRATTHTADSGTRKPVLYALITHELVATSGSCRPGAGNACFCTVT